MPSLAAGVELLDCDSARATHYASSGYVPLPAFFLAEPYVVANAGARKKRKRTTSDETRASREADANARHAAALPSLERALSCLRGPCVGDGCSGEGLEPADLFIVFAPPLPFPVPALPMCADDDARGEWLTRLVARGDGELVLGHAPPVPLTGRLHSNASGVAVVASVRGRRYVVPPYSSFALSPACLLRALPLGRFTLLILDPPWECASATRRCVGRRYLWIRTATLVYVLLSQSCIATFAGARMHPCPPPSWRTSPSVRCASRAARWWRYGASSRLLNPTPHHFDFSCCAPS